MAAPPAAPAVTIPPLAAAKPVSAQTTALLAQAEPVAAPRDAAPAALPTAMGVPYARGGLLHNGDFNTFGYWSSQPWGAPLISGAGPGPEPNDLAITIGDNTVEGSWRKGIGQSVSLVPGQRYQLQATGLSTTGTKLGICVSTAVWNLPAPPGPPSRAALPRRPACRLAMKAS